MVSIAVLGTSKFIVGFQLAGIRNTIEVSDNPLEDIKKLMGSKDIGIVVVDEAVLEGLDQDDRTEMEDSVEPVFIPVSEKVEQESLKRLIKRSIGVDLWS